MNNVRRKKIKKLMDAIERCQEELSSLSEDLEEVLGEEEEARDSLEENFSGTERYEKAEAAAGNLDEANNSLQEIISDLEDIDGKFGDLLSYLEDAME